MLFHFVNTDQIHASVFHAYSIFIQSHSHQVITHNNSSTVPFDASIVWWFCGRVPLKEAYRLRSSFQVHEYLSTSLPPYAWLKDQFTHWTSPRPDFRIYQNGWQRERMSFSDSVPYEYRDEGVKNHFFAIPSSSTTPEFDFVFHDELFHLLAFQNVLQAIYDSGRSLLLIGEMPKELNALLTPNITFLGPVDHREIPHHLRRAKFGLNLVSNVTPFNQQASSKVLNYCAVGLRVVSNSYPWVKYFMSHHQANFYLFPGVGTLLASNFGNGMEAFPYVVPNINHLSLLNNIKKLTIWKTIRL